MKYAIKRQKELNILERTTKYIDDIETFIYVINENKADIVKKYNKLKSKPFILSSNLKLIKKEENGGKNEIDSIIKLIKEIIEYSKNNDVLIIYLKSEFWINQLRQYNKSDLENINSCFGVRLL